MVRERRGIKAGFAVLLAEIKLEAVSPSCLYDLDWCRLLLGWSVHYKAIRRSRQDEKCWTDPTALLLIFLAFIAESFPFLCILIVVTHPHKLFIVLKSTFSWIDMSCFWPAVSDTSVVTSSNIGFFSQNFLLLISCCGLIRIIPLFV